MSRVARSAASLGMAAALVGCVSLRDSSLDHRLPPVSTPTVDLAAYRSVQDRGDGQDPELALAAAISGGGHRAANFAMGVLLALEAFEVDGRPLDLLREIDYFSTVSGGGFAAGTYVSTLHDHLQAAGGERRGYSLARTLEAHDRRALVNLERDYQGTAFGGLSTLRCLGYRDGGDVFERKLDRYVLGAKYRDEKRSLTLGDVFRKHGASGPVALPYWVPNATVYENGARFPFTPDVLAKYHVTGFTHGMKGGSLEGDPFTMPLGVGVKASASFPVVFPATTLPCLDPDDRLNRFLHLMDGGLADNMGYRTAIELLKQDRAERKVLLVIDAYKGVSHPCSSSARSPGGPEAGYRTLTIALDGEHSRLEATARRLARPDGGKDEGPPIEVVFLSFSELRPALVERLEDVSRERARLREERRRAVGRRLRREVDVMLDQNEEEFREAEAGRALYMDARAVATSLNITRGEQRLLLEAGRAVVGRNSALLRDCVLGGEKGGE